MMEVRCKRVGLVVCLLVGVLLLLGSCKKKKEETPWTLAGRWTVERVTVQGVIQEGHPAVGRVYDFQENGQCLITEPDGTSVDAGKWKRDEGNRQLIIGDTKYMLYRAEDSTLEFGRVMGGQDGGTYHAVRQ